MSNCESECNCRVCEVNVFVSDVSNVILDELSEVRVLDFVIDLRVSDVIN